MHDKNKAKMVSLQVFLFNVRTSIPSGVFLDLQFSTVFFFVARIRMARLKCVKFYEYSRDDLIFSWNIL